MPTAKLVNTRAGNGNPISQLHMPEGSVYTFQGLSRIDRAEALIDQLGYRKMWKAWKQVSSACPHGDCHRTEVRMRIVPQLAPVAE